MVESSSAWSQLARSVGWSAKIEKISLSSEAETECDASGVSMVSATYSWLLRYSALSGVDGALLGASSAKHLHQNVDACRGDGIELPDAVVAALDGAYDITRAGAFKYWRSFSADFPGREGRDQGASYQAAKAKA